MLRVSNICLLLSAFVFESGVFCQDYVPMNVEGIALDVFPASINEQGKIAGSWIDGFMRQRGFVCTQDGRTNFFESGCTSIDAPVPGNPFIVQTFTNGINDAGAVTGIITFLRSRRMPLYSAPAMDMFAIPTGTSLRSIRRAAFQQWLLASMQKGTSLGIINWRI